MANRIRQIDEKVEPVKIALKQINVEAAAIEAGVPPSTLRYDLDKVEQALPEVLENQKPGPKPQPKPVETSAEVSTDDEEPTECPKCGGKVTKNGTYWVLNWFLRSACIGNVIGWVAGSTEGAYSTLSVQGVWVRTRFARAGSASRSEASLVASSGTLGEFEPLQVALVSAPDPSSGQVCVRAVGVDWVH